MIGVKCEGLLQLSMIGANFEFLDQGLEEPHEYAKIQ